MNITVNGETREVPDDLTVLHLLEHLGLPPAHVAVEVNREIVRRAEHASHHVKAGDALELVHFVGGG